MKLLSNIRCYIRDESVKRFQFELLIDGVERSFEWFYDSSFGGEWFAEEYCVTDLSGKLELFLDFILNEFDENGISIKDCQHLVK